MWWLPEVMRLRAAHDDDEETAISRLGSAARMASTHGSIALLRRCERDLAARGAFARLPPEAFSCPEAFSWCSEAFSWCSEAFC